MEFIYELIWLCILDYIKLLFGDIDGYKIWLMMI